MVHAAWSCACSTLRALAGRHAGANLLHRLLAVHASCASDSYILNKTLCVLFMHACFPLCFL